jgi:hypothetical protein
MGDIFPHSREFRDQVYTKSYRMKGFLGSSYIMVDFLTAASQILCLHN